MAVRIEVTSQSLIVSLTGLDVVWALKRRLVINRADIVSVKLMERKEAIKRFLERSREGGPRRPGGDGEGKPAPKSSDVNVPAPR